MEVVDALRHGARVAAVRRAEVGAELHAHAERFEVAHAPLDLRVVDARPKAR